MRISLSIQLIVYFLLLSIASIFVVGKFSYLKTKEALINRTYDQLISIRTEKEKRIQNFFSQCNRDLNNITDLNDTKQILKNICLYNDDKAKRTLSKYILGYLQASKRYDKIIFIDTLKNIFEYDINSKRSVILNKNYKSFASIYGSIIRENKTIVDEAVINKKHSINIGRPVYSPQNELLGIIILNISYQAIDNIMFENNIYNGLGQTGEVYLVGNDFLMRSSSRFLKNSKFKTIVKTRSVINALKNKSGKSIIKDYRNIRVFSSYNRLNVSGLKWVILSEIDEKEAMEPINNVENNIIYLSIVISLLLLGIVAALSSNITSPIRKLQAETEKIYNGNYGDVLKLKCNNEIGDLIDAFNKMSLKLKEQKDRLEYEQVIRTSYVIDAQESERQRLSRELHDGLAQYILSIKLKLEYALSLQGAEQITVIKEAKNLFAETIQEIRNISNNLMPSVLNEYGITKAIENLAFSVNNDTEMKFIFSSNLKDSMLNKKSQIYIYRIIQEALSNTIKHANASTFEVKFIQNEKMLFIDIKDDGKGFDIKNKLYKTGNGLANIKERVNLLSGGINIISGMKSGFLLKISLPL